MLNNIAVPIGYPNGSVRSYFGKHGREPLVGPGHQVEAHPVALFVRKVGAFGDHHVLMQNMARWFGHKRDAVPVGFGEGAGCIKIVARCRREAPEHVHLPHVGGDGLHVFVGIRASASVFAEMCCSRKIMLRNGHIPAVRVIGR